MKKKNKYKALGTASRGIWWVTFSDLMMLILTFFVMIYTLTERDLFKIEQVYKSIAKAFNIDASTTEKMDFSQEKAKDRVTTLIRPSAIQVELMRLQELTGDIEVGETKNDIVINLSNEVLFDLGSVALNDSVKTTLNRIIKVLSKVDNRIRIEGYTDDVQPTSNLYESNWELSAARAVEVLKYLYEEGDIPMNRLIAAGYGEYRPLLANDTVSGNMKNRRVSIVILDAKQPRDFRNLRGSFKFGGFKFKAPAEEQ